MTTISEAVADAAHLVDGERVHRRAFSDAAVFEQELDRIFGQTWLYVGHESQVPRAGDYVTTQLGRQPVIMCRHQDGKIYVLENRCPHNGALVCAERAGTVRKYFSCMYHGWAFDTDGALRHVPLPEDYAGTGFDTGNPANGMKRVPRVANHRGFVFAALSATAPDFQGWAGAALEGFDNMLDRAPDGEVEVAGDCYRIIQQSNWKIFLNNMFDNVHPGYVHGASGRAAKTAVESFGDTTRDRVGLDILGLLTVDDSYWKTLALEGYADGHALMSAFIPQRQDDPEQRGYRDALAARHGREQAEEILSRNIHHALLYPSVVLQPSFQQLRVVRPLAVDRTMLEIWVFRLKGAPPSFFRRAISYANIANSPSNIVSADDLESYNRVHRGLTGPGSDWVLFHREAPRESADGAAIKGASGTSELVQRNMFKSWRQYMAAR
jgi:phenylpropionate dioxygenase-like ring-hydroxylating dioxygenase large terminal subunit